MRILIKLEKSKAFWSLLPISLLFFFFRLPSLIEPYWYGDEGIYQVIGQALHSGRLLYAQIWDNKPPLLYIIYAIFNGDQFNVRIFSLIVGLLTSILFFYFSLLLFKKLKISVISTLFFTFIFATPFWEGNIANAENFMLLPIIGSGIILYKFTNLDKQKLARNKNLLIEKKSFLVYLSAGLLLGIAFLLKIVAVFDFAAFFIFLLFSSLNKDFKFSKLKDSLKNSLIFALPYLVGFILPLIITSLYFVLHNAFPDFIHAVFFSNVGYVGYGNKLIIPQGFLILKLILLGGLVCFVFWKRNQINRPTMFVILWFAFSLFNAYFSGRPYTHYALVTLPSLCLLIGLFLSTNEKRRRVIFFLIFFISIILLNSTFKFNLDRTIKYYGNTLSFLTGRKNVNSYQTFFDKKTPRDYELSIFIKTHTNKDDNVFIWGNSAQIYALSGKLPPGKYTVAYHITQGAFKSTQNDINKTKPKYIIALTDTQPIPFYLPAYVSRFVFDGSIVYERSN